MTSISGEFWLILISATADTCFNKKAAGPMLVIHSGLHKNFLWGRTSHYSFSGKKNVIQEFQFSSVAHFHYHATQSSPPVALLSENIYGTALKTQSMKTAKFKKQRSSPKEIFFFFLIQIF